VYLITSADLISLDFKAAVSALPVPLFAPVLIQYSQHNTKFLVVMINLVSKIIFALT
jgi:hypothetical protein